MPVLRLFRMSSHTFVAVPVAAPRQAWNELPQSVRTGGRPNKEEALLAVAVVNRVRRALADVSAGEERTGMAERAGSSNYAQS